VSQFVADQLTGALLERLSIERAIERAHWAIVICSIDEHGWPHPAMVSSLEIVARDARNIRLTTHRTSQTTRNLTTNGMITVVLTDDVSVFYIKGDVRLLAAQLAAAPDQTKFNLRVDGVWEDAAAAHEEARVVSGIRVERAVDAERALTVLRELIAG
jgi:hypothetical protein